MSDLQQQNILNRIEDLEDKAWRDSDRIGELENKVVELKKEIQKILHPSENDSIEKIMPKKTFWIVMENYRCQNRPISIFENEKEAKTRMLECERQAGSAISYDVVPATLWVRK